ncbi:MAG: hypothetical protein WC889_08505, partial [Myxococcota bacterium]
MRVAAAVITIFLLALSGCQQTESAGADAGVQDAGLPQISDRDMDGVPDELDRWPDDRCCSSDTDSDGICDGRDTDTPPQALAAFRTAAVPGAVTRQPDRCDFGGTRKGPFWLKGD